MNRDQCCKDSVQYPLGDFLAVFIQDCFICHQMAHITHKHQRASGQRYLRAIYANVSAIGVQLSHHVFVIFENRFGQITSHQSEPIFIDDNLVLRVDRGDRVLTVHNRGQCGLHKNVSDSGRI